jgi:hypothetical protein
MEIVHIELSDERGEVTMLEISRKHTLTKLSHFLYNKSVPFLVPGNNIIMLIVLRKLSTNNYIPQEFHKFSTRKQEQSKSIVLESSSFLNPPSFSLRSIFLFF